jgi:hypothetical protein
MHEATNFSKEDWLAGWLYYIKPPPPPCVIDD